MPLDDGDRGLAQPQRPPRVAELAPGADDVGRRGGGEVGRRRPAGQPLPPDRLDPGDRRLLQHHLADQHRPRVDAGTAPRQVAGGGGVPVDDRLAGVRTGRCAAGRGGGWSREPSLPCRRSGVPAGPARGAAPLAFPACCTRSATCPPPSTGGAGWCCWPCCSSSWAAGLAAAAAAAGAGTRTAAAAAAGQRRAPSGTPALERVVPSLAPVAHADAARCRRRRRSPRRRRPPRAGPGAGRPVHRRHDRRSTVRAPGVGRRRQQADVRRWWSPNVSAVPCVRALDKGAAGARAARRRRAPGLGQQRLLPGGEQRPRGRWRRARRSTFPIVWGGLTSEPGCTAPACRAAAGRLRAARAAGHARPRRRRARSTPRLTVSCSGRGSRSRPAGTGPRGCRGPGPRRRPRRPAGPRSWRRAASAGRRSGRPAGR